MRICYITGEFPPMQGGVGDYTRRLSETMQARGHVVRVLTSVRAQPPLPDAEFEISPQVASWDWSFWRQVDALMRSFQPDVLNVQYQTAAFEMHPAVNVLPWHLRRRRALFIVTFHDLREPYLFRGARPLRRWITDFLARRADGVIVTNEEDDAALAGRVPTTPRRLIPIGPNVLPPSPARFDRDAWRARWGIAPDECALSYFGFLNPTKGAEDLVRATSLLLAEGRRVKLLMVGGTVGASDPTNLAYLEKVKALMAELGVAGRVVWTDFLPDEEVSATLWACDACVLPYRDGVSTRRGTLMAALAHGLPIVTTFPQIDAGYFRDGENLLLVPPADPPALARAIARLLDAPALRERLRAGAAQLAERFTWPIIARSTEEFYLHLLRGRG